MAASESLIWKEWDGEAVVFDERSGDTSYIDCVHMEIIHRLRENAADEADLHNRIAAFLNWPIGDEVRACVAAACRHLQRLDLIQPVTA